jgi:PAS domain S-box-containing protein
MRDFFAEDYENPVFLSGGGEMGELTRQFDWASTAVGPVKNWPQSLRMTVAMILSSKAPMFLWWGHHLVQFYNDAYRPSFGEQGKHPKALGQTGEDCWPEIWPVIKPMIDQVMSGGGGTYNENQLIPIYRNGSLEDVYWTFSYNPVLDDSYKIGGVLVVCQETTREIKALQNLELSEARFRSVVEQAPMAIGLLSGPEMIIEAGNDKIFEVWGKDSSITGLPILEGLPEIKDQDFPKLLQEVYQSGKPYFGESVLAKLDHNGHPRDLYFDFTYTPLKDPAGSTKGVMVLANDITEEFDAKKDLQASEAKLRAIIDQAPVATCLFAGDELTVEMANSPMIAYWGKDVSVIGKPLKEALPELVDQPFLQILHDIYKTGEAYSATDAAVDIIVNGVLGTYYFNFTYKPLFDSNGEIFGIINMSIDVTKQVLAQKALAASEAMLRSVIASSPSAMGIFVGRELVIEMPNQAFIDMMAKGPDIAGKPLRQVMPELEQQDFLEILDHVYSSGKPYQTFGALVDVERDGELTSDYYDIIYAPVLGSDQKVQAILEIATNVTQRVAASKIVEESQIELLALFEQSPVAIAILDSRELAFTLANPFFSQLIGYPAESLIGKPLGQVLPEMVGQGFDKVLYEVLASGEPYFSKEQAVKIHKDGATIYVDLTCQPKRESDDTITGVLIVATDITEQVLVRQKVERAETSLRGAIELAQLGTYEIDLITGVLKYSDRLKKWFGVQKEEVITFEKVYAAISPADLPAVVAAVNRAIEPGSDGLYDMEYTMDETKTGFARILRAQGKVFYDRHGNPVTMVGTAQDVTEQRKIQHALEIQVQQRTEELESANEELAAGNEELAAINEEFQFINDELNRTNALLASSNDNLQQFAYVASHDLQEPLRKVQSFGDLLMSRYGQQLGSGQDLVRRMQEAANRMSTLIQDLLIFSRVSSADPAATVVVRLDQVIESVLGDLELIIQELGARITVDRLPQVTGDQVQLSQLFQNLLSNALKFQNAGATPIVRISYARITNNDLPVTTKTIISSPNYHRIDVVDNGIGFDIAYTERIFQVFQRLHGRSEYAGTGIGLAICEKVVLNHGGAILAASIVGQGSTFTVILPSGPELHEFPSER